jgi:hypothetical protein
MLDNKIMIMMIGAFSQRNKFLRLTIQSSGGNNQIEELAVIEFEGGRGVFFIAASVGEVSTGLREWWQNQAP